MSRNWIPAILVTGLFVVALILFRINGGFGGGHGAYDQVIFLASLPWGLLEGALPESIWNTVGDLGIFVVIPFLLNMASVYLVLGLVRSIRSRRSN